MAVTRKRSDGHTLNESAAFKNVKNQIAYCGLWCGSCHVGNGTLNQQAASCSKTIRDYGVHEWGSKDVNYDCLFEGLATIASMKPCVGCLRGGGRTDCEIRSCARQKNVAECVECGKERTCENAGIIEHMRSGALNVGMKVKKRIGNRSTQVGKWMVEHEHA